MSPTDDKSLAAFGPAWAGCRIEGDRLILNNGETYTVQELEALRWERNSYKRLARALQTDLDRTGMEGAIKFPLEELTTIRQALRLLDARLPGESMQVPTNARRHRRA